VGAGPALIEILDASFEGDSAPGAFERVVQELRAAGELDFETRA
jgi:hypothetical protein